MIKLSKVSPFHFLMIALLVFASHRADAYSITQSFEVVNAGNTDIEFYLDPFDANLGTLTNVYIDFRSSSSIMSNQFECTVVNPLWCTAVGFVSLYFFPGNSPFLIHTTDNIHSFRQGDSTQFIVSQSAPPWWPNNLLVLSSFTEFSPRVVASEWWRCEANCTDSEFYSGTQTLRGTLTYEYVPVPATLALLVFGLVGLGVSRRA